MFARSYFGRPQCLALARSPGVFVHQVTGAALHRLSKRGAIIQSLSLWHMAGGIKGAVDMTALAVFCDDTVTLDWLYTAFERIVERLGAASG